MGSLANGEAVSSDDARMEERADAWSNLEMSNFDTRAMGAATAAYQADMASKHCMALAVWVQHLWGQVHLLQGKVTELEDWKRRALDEVRRLRDDQKELKLRVTDAAQEGGVLPRRADTVPAHGIPNPGPPPGLSTPPGLREETVDSGAFGNPSELTSGCTSSSVTTETDGMIEGIQVTEGEVEGKPCEIAEWRIGHLSSKLNGCMGKALVSPPFTAAGHEDVRLMVFPEGKDAARGLRSKRQKELYAKKVSEGPLDGCLKMKFVPEEGSLVLEYYLSVGSERRGPFKHDFGEQNINGCYDFGVDWLKQLDQDQSLTVRAQILKA
ncbi:unnamed protein product [Prorocentrum cordatum]|uniref:Uncharacterized protein n=1 Tax=Prorocentrum cordatum TaxID=2364126 RepID=A0ABN9TTH8_9DINO|nr:unnamed protein product [Polarella glacialis]